MNGERRAILALIAMGRITPSEAERLLAVWNESRETAWILIASIGLALLRQVNLHEVMRVLGRLVSVQISGLAHILGAVTGGVL